MVNIFGVKTDDIQPGDFVLPMGDTVRRVSRRIGDKLSAAGPCEMDCNDICAHWSMVHNFFESTD